MSFPILLNLVACSADELVGVFEVTGQTSSDQVTALDIAWEQDPPGVSRIRVIQGARSWTSPWSEAGWDHSQRVAGLRADAEVEIQVELADGRTGEVHALWTEPLPAWIPELSVSGRASQGFAVPVLDAGGESVLLELDSEGEVVGYSQGFDYLTAADALDGGSLMALADGVLLSVDLERRHSQAPMSAAHHDLAMAPDGRVAWLSLGDELRGEQVVLRDDSGERVIFDMDEHFLELELSTYEEGAPIRTSHFNSLSWDPYRDAWLVSWGQPAGLMWLDDRGGILDVQDFRGLVGHAVDLPASVELTHQASPTPQGVLVMANVVAGSDCSQVLELEFLGDHLAQTGAYEGGCQQIFGLGGVRPMGPSETLVTWSTAGLLEVLEGDEVQMDVTLPFGFGFGYAAPFEELLQER
jgi:hypothetical protein